jgi:hypothetical protein
MKIENRCSLKYFFNTLKFEENKFLYVTNILSANNDLNTERNVAIIQTFKNL